MPGLIRGVMDSAWLVSDFSRGLGLGFCVVLRRKRRAGARLWVSEELLCCRVLGCHGKRLDVAELS